MFGKGALIMVMGFGVIAGYMTLNISRLTSNAVASMIGYYQLNDSRTLANAGANIGLAMLTKDATWRNRPGTMTSQSPKIGSFGGTSLIVTLDTFITQVKNNFVDSISTLTTNTIRIRSVSTCATNITYMSGDSVKMTDTVEVRLHALTTATTSFSTYSWLTNNENGVYFISKDTLWGDVHSNGNININGAPTFWGKVTTSGTFSPAISTKSKKTSDSAHFYGNYETNVAKRNFPNDLSGLAQHKTNSDTNKCLYVTLKPGTTADNDGYAIVRKNGFTGPIVDSMLLSGTTDNVIYSDSLIRVQGTLDGRLSISSKRDIWLDNDITYEREPDPKDSSSPKNGPTDMLGLIAEKNVIVTDNAANSHVGSGKQDMYLDAAIFCRTGSFTAENYSGRGIEGTIRIIGSVCQNVQEEL